MELLPIVLGFVVMAVIGVSQIRVPASTDYQSLFDQCRGSETTATTLEHVYQELHNVPATEALCGVSALKVEKGKVVNFELEPNRR
jgi:hypothetical protein